MLVHFALCAKAILMYAQNMEDSPDRIEIRSEDAQGGAPPQGVRYVLFFSLLLAVVLMTLVWVIPALFF